MKKTSSREPEPKTRLTSRTFVVFGLLLFLVHAFLMLYRYGQLPVAPVIGDEVIINDPAIALSRGQGLIAPSFVDSAVGIDKLYAHFPPLYIYAESVAFRWMGVSVYSLRLATTIMDLVSAATFLLLLWCLCRWRLASWGTAILAAPLYLLNATVIVLHRIARMESMIEALTLIGFTLVLRGIYGPVSRDEVSRAEMSADKPGEEALWHRLAYLLAGAVFGGLSMATHPEALLPVIPIVLLLGFAAPVHRGIRVLLVGITGATPIGVWVASYGSRSWGALMEMRDILRYNTDPQPGILNYAHDFLRETHRNASQGMRATLFFFCLLVLEVILLRWAMLESRSLGRRVALSVDGARRLLLAEIFAASCLITLVMLTWFVSASITRYEVIFPLYLAGMVIALRGFGRNRPVAVTVAVITGVQVLAMIFQLQKNMHAREDLSADRFDGIVQSIRPGMRVAATPMLWLAFEQKGRAVTLLYRGFDGLPKWRANGANPLAQFDAVIVDTSFQTEFHVYSPYAAQGRRKLAYEIGDGEVDLYLPSK